MKKLTVLLVTLALLLVALVVLNITIKAEQMMKFAPDFTIKDLEGNEISLSDYQGNVVVLNFWATWCPPCRQEIPGFIEVYEKYKDQGMVILGVSVDSKGPMVVKQFADKYEINYPLAMATQKMYNDYDPGEYIPATFIIDRQGKIQDKHVGFLDKERLEDHFLELSK